MSEEEQKENQEKPEKTSEQVKDEKKTFLSFYLGEQEYAVDAHKVDTINEPLEVTPVPAAPSYVEGIANLKGTIVALIDLCHLLNQENVDQENSRLIVLTYKGVTVGFKVGSIKGIEKISTQTMEPPPVTSENARANYLTGIIKQDKRIISILDLDSLIFKKRVGVDAENSE